MLSKRECASGICAAIQIRVGRGQKPHVARYALRKDNEFPVIFALLVQYEFGSCFGDKKTAVSAQPTGAKFLATFKKLLEGDADLSRKYGGWSLV